MRKIIGCCMIIGFFLGMFIFFGITVGLKETLKAYGVSIGIVGFIFIAVSLLEHE